MARVARLPKYGPDIAVEAFSLIHARRPNTRLVLAGAGHMRPALEQRIRQLRLEGAIELPGRVPHERVPQLIQSIDLMIMPWAIANGQLPSAPLSI